MQHVADDVAGPGSAEAGPSLRVWIQRVLRHVGQGGTSQLWLSSHLSVCLSVTVSLCLCLSLILSACVSVSLSASLSFTLSDSTCLTLCLSLFQFHSVCLILCACLSVCVSLSSCLSFALSDSVYQQHNLFIFTDTDMFFSYSCFSTMILCHTKSLYYYNYQMKIHTRGVISLLVKQQYETNKVGEKRIKVLKQIGLFLRPDNGQGKQCQAAGRADEATV